MTSKKPRAFVLYPDQWPALECLSAQQLGWLLQAIFRSLRGEGQQEVERTLPSDVLIAYRFMMLQIQIDIEKYNRTSEERRKAVSRRWQKNVKNGDSSSDTNVSFVLHKKEKENEKEKEKENETENENENETEKETEKESGSGAAEGRGAEGEASAAAAAAQQRSKKFMEWFNGALGEDSAIPRLRRMTKQRAALLNALMAEGYTMDDVATAIRRARASPFLNGRGKRNRFVATFDWLFKAENFVKVLEGQYN